MKEQEFQFKTKTSGKKAQVQADVQKVEAVRSSPRKAKKQSPAAKASASARVAAEAVAPRSSGGDEALLTDLLDEVERICRKGGEDTMEIWHRFKVKARTLLSLEEAQMHELKEYERELDAILARPAAELLDRSAAEKPVELLPEHAQLLAELREGLVDKESVAQAVIRADMVALDLVNQVEMLQNVQEAVGKRLVELADEVKQTSPFHTKEGANRKKKKAKTDQKD